MAAAGRRWQRCSSCGCRLMSASGQRPCWRSHGRGHHLPGRSTSIRALWRTAWLHESACWAVAVERWARRAPTRRRKGLFQPFVRYLTHLDLATARHRVSPTVPGDRCESASVIFHIRGARMCNRECLSGNKTLSLTRNASPLGFCLHMNAATRYNLRVCIRPFTQYISTSLSYSLRAG